MSLKIYNFEKPSIVIHFFKKRHRQKFPVGTTLVCKFPRILFTLSVRVISVSEVAALFEILKLRFELIYFTFDPLIFINLFSFQLIYINTSFYNFLFVHLKSISFFRSCFQIKYIFSLDR